MTPSAEHGSCAAAAPLARDVKGEVEAADDGGQHAHNKDGGLQTLDPETPPLCLSAAEIGAVVAEPAPRWSILLLQAFCW